MTAISVVGAFEVMAFSVTKDIVVSGCNRDWPHWFDQIRDFPWPAVDYWERAPPG